MSTSATQKRMADNEAVFRHYNETVTEKFAEIVRLAQEAGQDDLIKDDDTPLHFYCECSDENCTQRIQLKPSEYAEIHTDRARFILVPGHETTMIERIVKKLPHLSVVEKLVRPSDSARVLQPTPVKNS